jgi:hypothetical protein
VPDPRATVSARTEGPAFTGRHHLPAVLPARRVGVRRVSCPHHDWLAGVAPDHNRSSLAKGNARRARPFCSYRAVPGGSRGAGEGPPRAARPASGRGAQGRRPPASGTRARACGRTALKAPTPPCLGCASRCVGRHQPSSISGPDTIGSRSGAARRWPARAVIRSGSIEVAARPEPEAPALRDDPFARSPGPSEPRQPRSREARRPMPATSPPPWTDNRLIRRWLSCRNRSSGTCPRADKRRTLRGRARRSGRPAAGGSGERRSGIAATGAALARGAEGRGLPKRMDAFPRALAAQHAEAAGKGGFPGIAATGAAPARGAEGRGLPKRMDAFPRALAAQHAEAAGKGGFPGIAAEAPRPPGVPAGGFLKARADAFAGARLRPPRRAAGAARRGRGGR